MIAVIFEVWAKNRKAYLDIASDLTLRLDQIDGFLSVERFESLSEKEKILSLSFWRDEEAVKVWRNQPEHR
jgi:heme-degrading monooxygenase HmoA